MTDVNVNVPTIVKGWFLLVAGMFGFVAGFMSGVVFVVLAS